MIKEHKIKGLILKRIPYQNEKTVLFSVYARELGKIIVGANFSGKMNSLGRILAPLNICELVLTQKDDGKYRVKDMVLIESYYPDISEDIKNLQHAFAICELIEKISPEQCGNSEEIFNIINEGLKKAREAKKEAVYYALTLKLLMTLGYIPMYDKCENCKCRCEEGVYGMKEHEFAIFCDKCRSQDETYTLVSYRLLKSIRYLSATSYDFVSKIVFSENDINALQKLLSMFKTTVAGSEFRSDKATMLS